ncbi:Mic60p [Sugiyamaella lignohabitans]|uniref:MICOS complex subunit MIC60 n=1 Tax=Sugiyamaella lignohabitans TaxID=796027 RepID=A0A167EZW3_9ASCO|nr:Mic60p [Sugiyamaella lignohabitans]ANB14653.1 Mic60p [Sugiyamaella lignohabitans]
MTVTPPVKVTPPVIEPVVKEAPKQKKSHGFRNFVLSTVFLSSALYGAGVWYSLKDDTFHDYFTEYVPFSESIIVAIEEREFRSKFRDVNINQGGATASTAVANGSGPLLQSIPGKLNDLKVKIRPGSSAEPKEISSDQATKSSSSSAVTAASSSSKSADKNASIARPSSSDSSAKNIVTEKKEGIIPSGIGAPTAGGSSSHLLPLIRVPGDINPLVASSVETLNQFIQSVNTSTYGEDIVHKISQEVSKLSHSINALNKENQETLSKSLESQAAKFAALGEARANEVKEALASQEDKWRQQFQEEQARILKLYNDRLLTEVEATKNLVISHANNRLLAIHAEREKQFAQEIQDRVEKERDGRLSKIKELAEKVEALSHLTEKTSSIISESDSVSQYHIAVGKLNSVLKFSNEPVPLGPYIEEVRKALSDDPLVQSILDNIPEDAYKEGVLTNAQLAARFKLLVPELRSASLLPPNAGVAGHIGSIIFSQLLAGKSGNPVGNDNESIFARAETALGEGRVVDAVAEVNSLTGWPKKLAADWLSEGRKRSEVDFLAQALADEGKLWALK